MNNNLSSIEVKATSKGLYYWSIKVNFDENSIGNYRQAAEVAKDIDIRLRELFPKNVFDIVGKSSFKEIAEVW